MTHPRKTKQIPSSLRSNLSINGYSVRWIDKRRDLEHYLKQQKGNVIAVDTESDYGLAYKVRVCLIQLCHDGGCALVDVLSMSRDDLKPLLVLLEDPEVVIVMHSADSDIRELNRDYAVNVRNVFDTQVALRFLGVKQLGLATWLKSSFGVTTDKNYQRYDWRIRPLSNKAASYAAMDVAYLLESRLRLTKRLKATGWCEAFRQTCEAVAKESIYEEKPFDPEGWRNLKGTSKIGKKSASILKSLYQLRHDYCLKTNEASSVVMSTVAMVKISTQRPQKLSDFAAIKGLSPRFVEVMGMEVLKIVEQAPDSRPEKVRLESKREVHVNRNLYEKLRGWRNTGAATYKIPSHYLANNDALERLSTYDIATLEDVSRLGHFLPWQMEIFGADLLELIVQFHKR